jgi:hypothetical protein
MNETQRLIELCRSPRVLLERDGHPGPGPGHLALVMARAGVGKTAFLTGIGIDAMLQGHNVLHITFDRAVENVRTWYDDLVEEMLRHEKKLQHWAAIQLEVERRRHIHTYVGTSFSVDRLRSGLELLRDAMQYVPSVILVDRLQEKDTTRETVEALKAIAGEVGAEIWLACQTHRESPAKPGHLPKPAERFEDVVDTAFSLDPHNTRIRLRVLKDNNEMMDKDLNILLDPQSFLLVTGVKRS